MWKQLVDAVLAVFSFAQRLERQEQALKDQQQESRELTAVVQRLTVELQRTQDDLRHSQEREADARRMLLLEMENRLLKSQLQLPPAKPETLTIEMSEAPELLESDEADDPDDAAEASLPAVS